MSGHFPESPTDSAGSSPQVSEIRSTQENPAFGGEKPGGGLPATSCLRWIGQAQKGSESAFAAIFERYHRRLALYLHYHLSVELRGKLEVDDLLQEVLLRAFRDLGQFEYHSPGSFSRWLFRIASHVVRDGVRYHAREKRQAEETLSFRSESNPFGPEPAHSWTPSRILSSDEEVKKLMDKLDALPEEYRRVILLTKIEGLTTAEAAARMGKSRENTSLLLHRALQRFRILLDQ